MFEEAPATSLRLRMTERGPAFVAALERPRRTVRWYTSVGGIAGATVICAVLLSLYIGTVQSRVDGGAATFGGLSVPGKLFLFFYESVAVYYLLVVPACFLARLRSRRLTSDRRVARSLKTDLRASPVMLYGPFIVAMGWPWVVFTLGVILGAAQAFWSSLENL
jgi:hypothetical protein